MDFMKIMMKLKISDMTGKPASGFTFLLLLGTMFATTVHADCQPFLVESNNGDGGFRFMHDVENFRTVSSGTRYENVICDRKSFQVELAKKNPGARVRFSIDGKPYEFAEGDEGDKQAKSWYRKYFDVSF